MGNWRGHLVPQNLPAEVPTGSRSLTALEWTVEILKFGDVGEPLGNFRMSATFLAPVGGFTFACFIQNVQHGHEPGDYDVILGQTTGLGIAITAQYEFAGLLDGIWAQADPEVTPRWAVFFPNVDGLGKITSNTATRSTLAKPITLRFMVRRTGFVSNVGADAHVRKNVSGAYIALPGNYAVWEWSVAYEDGRCERIATHIVPSPATDSLSKTSRILSLQSEVFDTELPLSNDPCDVLYRDVRFFDGDTGSWHELLDWKIDFVDPAADPTYGWTPKDGKLRHNVGLEAGLDAVGNWLLRGLLPFAEPREPGPLARAPLLEVGVQSFGAGSAVFTGYQAELPGATPPHIQQERDRGFYTMRPAPGFGAVLVYRCPCDGLFTLTGDFARANDSFGLGDGVDVDVVLREETLFAASISPFHTVDPDHPFAGGGNRHFEIVRGLLAGDEIRFRVFSGPAGDRDYDATAFQLAVKFRPRADRWLSEVHDRAVRSHPETP